MFCLASLLRDLRHSNLGCTGTHRTQLLDKVMESSLVSCTQKPGHLVYSLHLLTTLFLRSLHPCS